LTPWQKTQVARHPERPRCLDYVAALITDFVALAGDRKFGDDEAIIGGFAASAATACVIGHEGLDHRGPACQFRHGAA
jgi:acetyl-CoA carboxylase carboxyl transferase subunit alpha